MPENEAWSLEVGCRKAGVGVGRRVPESEAGSWEEGCRKARLGAGRKGAGKRG